MAKLLFYDADHTYQLDGVTLPSVSEVTRFISKEIYGNINQYTLDNACARGTNVHKSTEVLDKFSEIECDEEIVPYVQAYVQFRRDYKISKDNIIEIESAYGDMELGYAGTIDRIYKVDDEIWLVDLKSSSAPQKRLWETCLNGYKILWEKQHPTEKITRMFDLQLKNDGTYKVLDVETNTDAFLACLTLQKLMEKKTKKNKEKK